MPELPDIKLYVAALEDRIVGHVLERLRVASPFVLRSTTPRPEEVAGLEVQTVGHQAKRIHIGLERDAHVFIHLMIAGRLHWKGAGAPLKGRNQLAALDFDDGTLVLTEAGTKRRAAIYLFRGDAGAAALDRGGLDPFAITEAAYRERLSSENHLLRALRDDAQGRLVHDRSEVRGGRGPQQPPRAPWPPPEERGRTRRGAFLRSPRDY